MYARRFEKTFSKISSKLKCKTRYNRAQNVYEGVLHNGILSTYEQLHLTVRGCVRVHIFLTLTLSLRQMLVCH